MDMYTLLTKWQPQLRWLLTQVSNYSLLDSVCSYSLQSTLAHFVCMEKAVTYMMHEDLNLVWCKESAPIYQENPP